MAKFLFNWSLIGSSLVEANTLTEAEEIWGEMWPLPKSDVDNADFNGEAILVETSPSCFADVDSEEGTAYVTGLEKAAFCYIGRK